jgi:hypothetical protein
MRFSSVILVVLGVALLSGCHSPSPKSHQGSAADTVSAKPDPNRVIGEWVRTDGGYTIKVLSVSPDGKMDAGYFNPSPIHVARAEWMISENRLVIFVELRDVNYPGSNYTLVYLPADDRLLGNYYQAVEQQNFDVEFRRQR